MGLGPVLPFNYFQFDSISSLSLLTPAYDDSLLYKRRIEVSVLTSYGPRTHSFDSPSSSSGKSGTSRLRSSSYHVGTHQVNGLGLDSVVSISHIRTGCLVRMPVISCEWDSLLGFCSVLFPASSLF